MNVLLINSNTFRQPWPVIPFGLVCVGAALERHGHEVRVLDLCFSKDCTADIKRQLQEKNPDLVGVSIRNIDNAAGANTTFLLEEVRDRVITPLKRMYDGPIVIGGPAVGINGAELLSYLDLSYAIRGDGEGAILELVARLQQKEPLDDLGGLVVREQGVVRIDNPPMLVEDLDDLPAPNPSRYIDLAPYTAFDSPLQIQTKRGCALSCSYCVYNKIEGKRYRLRDPVKLASDLATLTRKTGIDHVEITDSTFNVPLGHCKQVLRAIVNARLSLRLRAMGLHPGHIDEELVALMVRAGFKEADLGVESGSNSMLESLGKDFRVEDVIRAVELLQRKSIPITWYLLLGAPGETAETLRETFDLVNRVADPWDLIVISVGIRLYHGAPLAEKVVRTGACHTQDNFLSPVHYEPEGLGIDEIKQITKTEASRCPNYFLYHEEGAPESIQKTYAVLKRFWPIRHPIFRLHIAIRMAKKRLGRLH